jgi:hypothetical protein
MLDLPAEVVQLSLKKFVLLSALVKFLRRLLRVNMVSMAVCEGLG